MTEVKRLDPVPWPVKGTPKKHQLRALKEASLKPGHCYWMDPGAGKTFTCIAEAGMLYKMGRIDGMLVVAPNGPHIQWVEEQLPQWADFPYEAAHNKMTKRELDRFFLTQRDGLGVAAVNYHALNFKTGQDFVKKFMKLYPRIYLVVDESQKCKSPKSKWSRAVKRIADDCAYRRALSGTPLLNGIEDLFMQYDITIPGVTGCTSMTAFKRHYTIQERIYGAASRYAMKIVGYKNEDELKQLTQPYVTRIKRDEFMRYETEPMTMQRWVMMENREWERAYKSMRDFALAEIGGTDAVTAENALTILQKLQQIACGFVYDEAGEAVWYSSQRISDIADLVEELCEPVIIWTPYKALETAIRKAVLELDRPVFGKMNVEQWRDTQTGVLMGHQGSGLGVGMNLQHASANIYAANTFSAEQRWQSLYRTDRIGQTGAVRNWDFLTPGTVEENVLQALDRKEQLAINNIDTLRRLIA